MEAEVPIPDTLKNAANYLDGKTISKKEARDILDKSVQTISCEENISISEARSSFVATMMNRDIPIYCWRVISFKEVKDNTGESDK